MSTSKPFLSLLCIASIEFVAARSAAAEGDQPSALVLYQPDVAMVGRRFMIVLKAVPSEPAVKVTAPTSVQLYDRTRLPTELDQRRFYFRAVAAETGAEITFTLSEASATVAVDILTFEQLLQPREVNRIQLPRCWPMGEDLGELKTEHTLLGDAVLTKLEEAQASPDDSGYGDKADDEFWGIQPDCTIPRWHWVNLKLGCPVHGTEIYRGKAYYPWRMSLDQRWKVQCPVGKEYYPSNDFANADMTGGDYPDDGNGWIHNGQKYAFIAVYCQFLCHNAITHCRAPAEVYVKTGDIAAAHKALVALSRMAVEMGYLSVMLNHRYRGNEYTAYKTDVLGPPQLKDMRRLRSSGFGVYCIATPVMIENLAKAYDCVWGAADKDPDIVPFLQSKGIDAATGKDVRRFIEKYLFRVAAQGVLDASARSNLPRPQAAMCAIIKLLNYERGTELMDWLYDGEGAMRIFLANFYFKDGIAYESPGYNRCHVRDVPTIAEDIERIRELRPALFPVATYPPLAGSRRHRNVLESPIDFVCVDRGYPSVGDDGTYPHWAVLPKRVAAPGGDAAAQLHAYRTYHTPTFAWAALQAGAKPETAGLAEPELRAVADKLPADFRDRSMLFDGYGIATLRGGTGANARALWLKYGRFRGHTHEDVFEMGLMAKGNHVLTHFGYPRNWNYWYKTWTTHNTAREVPFKEHMGFPTLFAETDRVHVAEARSEAYGQTDADIIAVPGSFQRRFLALVDISPTSFYCVDIYRLSGGTEHWWAFHCHEGEFRTENLDLTPQGQGTLAGPGVAYGDESWLKDRAREFFAFPYLYNVQTARPQGVWRADWAIKGSENVHFRLHAFGPTGMELNVCDGKSAAGGSPYEMKFLLARNAGEAPARTQIVSVMEVYQGERPTLVDVRPVPISGGDDREGFAPIALRVTSAARTDTLMVSTDPDVERDVDGGIRFAGRFGLYAERDGKPVDVTLIGGTTLTRNGTGVTLTENTYQGTIAAVDRERQSIVISPAPPEPNAMVDSFIFIVNDAHRVAYRVLAAGRVEQGARLDLALDARTGIGQVSGHGDYVVTTPSRFILAKWRYYHGARLVNAAKTVEYRLLDVPGRAIIDRAVHPDATKARLEQEFPVGSWFEVWDYGVGDNVEWQHKASVRSLQQP